MCAEVRYRGYAPGYCTTYKYVIYSMVSVQQLNIAKTTPFFTWRSLYYMGPSHNAQFSMVVQSPYYIIL